jgi:hypothetical protein
MRTLVTSLPLWALFLIFVGGLMLLTEAAFATVVRYAGPNWRDLKSNMVVNALSRTIGALFGIMLGFLAVSLLQGFNSAESNVRNEATQLSELVRSSEAFPAPVRASIRSGVGEYVHDVVAFEWKSMVEGRPSPRVDDEISGLYSILIHFEPSTPTQRTFAANAVSELGNVVAARRQRLDSARETLPAVFQALIFAGAILTLFSTFFLRPLSSVLQGVLIGSAAFLIGATLLVIALLNVPFGGPVNVSQAPYREGALAGLTSPSGP